MPAQVVEVVVVAASIHQGYNSARVTNVLCRKKARGNAVESTGDLGEHSETIVRIVFGTAADEVRLKLMEAGEQLARRSCDYWLPNPF